MILALSNSLKLPITKAITANNTPENNGSTSSLNINMNIFSDSPSTRFLGNIAYPVIPNIIVKPATDCDYYTVNDKPNEYN